MFKKVIKPPKKTLDDLLKDKSIVTGEEVILNIKEQEKRYKEFQESVEFEQRQRMAKKT